MTPLVRGTLLALLSALAFGASAPLVQRFGESAGPWATAFMLYGGAAIVGLASSRPAQREARPRRANVVRIALAAAIGAAAAPALFAWGLQRTSAIGASLSLAFEGAATVVFAATFLREHVGARAWLAVVATTLGALFVAFASGPVVAPSTVGSLAVVFATILWAADNTLTGSLAFLDAGRVTFWKCAGGAMLSLLAAVVAREAFPSPAHAALLVFAGAVAYGLSLRLYLGAQRAFGAARTASVFGFAPFAGAAVAVALGEREGGFAFAAAGLLIFIAVVLHATERHGHRHAHPALVHEHAHAHPDEHHSHRHDGTGRLVHSHEHAHEPLVHAHAHAPDPHHRHTHGS